MYLSAAYKNTISGASKKAKLKTWFFKDLHAFICLVWPQGFLGVEEFAGLHGGD